MAELALIVCGARNWTDRDLSYAKLDAFYEQEPSLVVITGLARGADLIGDTWAKRRGLDPIGIAAEWTHHAAGWCPGAWCVLKNYCCAAGFRRNQQMLDRALSFERQFIMAFKDGYDPTKRGGGTEDMCKRARDAQVRGVVISHPKA